MLPHLGNTSKRAKVLKPAITLEAYKNSGKCSVIGPTNELKLGRLGEVLGFTDYTAKIKAN